MRSPTAILLVLVGCAADAEPVSIRWEPGQPREVVRAGLEWNEVTASGHDVYCDPVLPNPLHVQCDIAGETWIFARSRDRVETKVKGKTVFVDGQTIYDERRVWIWSGITDVHRVAKHEQGHVLMPVAGSRVETWHTATGIMRPDSSELEITPEVLGLCRQEGACK